MVRNKLELNRMKGFILNESKPHLPGMVAIHRQATIVTGTGFRTDCSCGAFLVGTYVGNSAMLPPRFCPDHGSAMSILRSTNKTDTRTGKYKGSEALYGCPVTSGHWWNRRTCPQMVELTTDFAGRVRDHREYEFNGFVGDV